MIKGTWQIIQWCPNLSAREWFNIGVGFNDGKNQYFKYLDDFNKLEKLFDIDTKKHLIEVIAFTEVFFNKGLYDFSPQIKLLEIGFSRGESIEECLDRTYKTVVTLGAHTR